ncbi:MAG: colicin V production protein [Nitrosomonadaceae bacterium]|nr:colicin V production protein [Nitrosomonadaceae bacterium]|tara:strand:+ start:439 stop:951 length:513 start_codon:yes stop_codon:yes gene_type:complete
MTIFDIAVLIIVAVSVLLSIVRGIVREALSLAGWVISYMTAKIFDKDFATVLPSSITDESLRIIISFIAVFLATLILMSMVTMLISALIRTVGLGSADRFFGAIFGFARGLLLVLLLVLSAGLTALPQEPFWQKSLLSKPLETGVIIILPWLPHGIVERINYSNEYIDNK